MIDIDTLYEQHLEAFFEECCDNRELDDLCYEVFADAPTQYCKWKLCSDSQDETVFTNAFKFLSKYDYEETVNDPLKCIKNYIKEMQK